MKLLLYHLECFYPDVDFLDEEGNVLIPKSVRPIIDYGITILGEKKGSIRQYRYGNLHVREYDNYYSVHSDIIDPRVDPLGHLLVDTPHIMRRIVSLAIAAKRYLQSQNVIE